MKFFLPMKQVPRTTHQQTQVRCVRGKPVFFMPQKLKEAQGRLHNALVPHVPAEPLTGPLQVVVKWCFAARTKAQHGTYKTTRPDTHNLNKLLFDVMTELKFWEDDAQVASEIIEKFWTVETPGIFIGIEKL